jgi:hypothetical protein
MMEGILGRARQRGIGVSLADSRGGAVVAWRRGVVACCASRWLREWARGGGREWECTAAHDRCRKAHKLARVSEADK